MSVTYAEDAPTLRDHVRVLGALILRDLLARFGRGNLGFVWTILEPMILTGGVMIVWSLIRPPVYHGVSIIAFVLTGYMPLTMWRHLMNSTNRILSGNVTLLYHRVISHIDILMARLVLEFLSTTTALLVVYLTVLSLGFVEPIYDYSLVLLGWLLTSWYFGAAGMVVAALGEIWEPSDKFIQPIQYLALPVSGVFFMVDWMPAFAQKLLWYNPTIHCFEIFRAGFFGPTQTTHYDAWFLIAACVAMTALGVFAMKHVREHIKNL